MARLGHRIMHPVTIEVSTAMEQTVCVFIQWLVVVWTWQMTPI